MEERMNDLLKRSLLYQEDITADRRHLHSHAESGFDLPETLTYVKNRLEAMETDVTEIGTSGLTASICGKKPGKVILLRADMDALPITEQTGLPFASQTQNMHACGHDMHTAMLIGAVRLLKEMEDRLEGTVKILFQPAEELLTGAVEMVKAGILENPSVDAAMMLHVMSDERTESGKVLFLQDGPVMASHDRFQISLTGKGCHGAMASSGIDPLVTLSSIHLALNELNSREIAAGKFLSATVGQMGGGTAANVIPETASMQGTIRTYDDAIRKQVKQRMEEIAVNMGRAFRTKAEVVFDSPCPSLVNDPQLRHDVWEYAVELFGRSGVLDLSLIGMGRMAASEDFSYISRKVPTVMVMLSAAAPEGDIYPMHHPKVVFDESVLHRGSALLAHTAARWLQDHAAG
jgi:amidohydrolase